MTGLLEVSATPAQRRMWAIEQEMPGSTQYTIAMEHVLDEALDPESLRVALGDVLARHEALRTRFRLSGGELRQQVIPLVPEIPLEYVDLTGPDDAAVQARFQLLRQEQQNTPFDLTAAPLLRMRHVRRRQRAQAGGAVYDTLLLAVHHLVADDISAQVIFSDLAAACATRAAGKEPGWESLAFQFSDYTAWLAERSRTPEAQRDREYWQRHLADLEDVDLTLGRQRSVTMTDHGMVIPVELDLDEAADVAELAREQRATAFTVLVSAFSAALGRVFGAREVAIGMSVADRPLPEVDQAVGLFTERLVLRVNVAGRPTFRQLTDQVRDEVLAAQEHGRVGFDEIIAVVAPSRQYGVTPLAQVSVNLRRVDSGDGARTGGDATVRHDLALDLADDGSMIRGALEFRSGIVDDAAAARVAWVFRAILRAGLTDPDAPVTAIAALDPDELRRLHAEQDGGPTAVGPPLPELVAGWAAATPDALAVDGPDGRLTYRELWAQVRELSGRLARQGVAPGSETPVLVAVSPGAVLPVCLLAVLLAGGVYVPVDPSAPPLFLAAAAEMIGARLALVTAASVMAAPPGVTLLPVDLACRPRPDRYGPPDRQISPSSAAYILFTSGSTGHPKAVLVEHRSLLGYVHGILRLLKPPPGAVHLMIQAPTFDSSLTLLCGALASGGVLRLAGQDAARDPGGLQRLLAGAPADYLKITPSHLAALLAGADPAVLRPRRALVLGGEASRSEFVSRLTSTGWNVVGHYGPAETTIGVLAHELWASAGQQPGTVPLGRPLPGVRVYVLDEALNPVPPGCRGEAYVAGALLARGYAGAPARTAEAFLPDPFAAAPGTRMYRTGDLVRRLPGGLFDYCGRRDRQAKVRGRRIEPAAVEHVLSGVPGVTDVAVVARDDRLEAYVVPGSPEMSAGQVRAAAAAALPDYLVPDHVVLLSALPLTVSGKLDVTALPGAGPQPCGEDARESVPPATPTEERLAELWCSVLAVPRVGVTDRFFDVGGDSIRAVYLVGAAAERGLRLATREVFDNQTIRGMAALLDEAGRDEPLPVRAVRAGLVGAVTPTVVRLVAPRPRRLDGGRAGIEPPGEMAGQARAPAGAGTIPDGVAVAWHEESVDLAGDPLDCDDRSLCELAARLAGPATHGELPAPGEAAALDGRTAGIARLPLSADVAAALSLDPRAASPFHEAYGTRAADIAAAAVLSALAADPDQRPASAGTAWQPQVLLADAYVELPRGGGRQAIPAPVRLDLMPADGWQDPRILLQATKAAITRARITCAAWTEDALAGRTLVPGVALRLLPLPAGARVIDPGTGEPDDPPGPVTTVILITGTELVVVATAADGGAAAGTLAGRVAGVLERLVAHCAASGPVYSPADFPEAELDDATLARLLDRIGLSEVTDPGRPTGPPL